MGSREERVGRNEALFREVNERISELGWPGSTEFLCECGDASCGEPIPISTADYDAIRADSRHFAVVPGHEMPDVERVVERRERYFVVEKLPGVPTEVAVETDPRL